MKKVTFFLICLWCVGINAQINIGGKPYSFENKVKAKKIVKNVTDKIILPPIFIEEIELEDEEDEANGIPPRFGYPFDVDLNLSNSGVWIEFENGDRLWKLEIHCPSAKSINLLYDEFYLPENGQLYLYNSAKTHHIGGFTERNNKGSKVNPGKFGTGLVYGDRIILEYFEPFKVKGEGKISISWVVHGYRYIDILNPLNTENAGFGNSGPCQVNVNCSPEGDNWQDEKKSVAMVLVGGFRWCTGSLINNTRLDGTSYFLTADHCIKYANPPKDAIIDPDAANWSFYWNYESPGCNNGTDFTPPSTTGAIVVANDYPSDFALFKLIENPLDLCITVPFYFNGWDRKNPGQGGVGIHHPVGDIKKIATHNIIPTTSNCATSSFWKINWQSTDNGETHPQMLEQTCL